MMFRNVVLCDVVKRSAYVHNVRGFRVAQSANIECMVVPTPLSGADSINCGRVVELVQYFDCRSVDEVGVESL